MDIPTITMNFTKYISNGSGYFLEIKEQLWLKIIIKDKFSVRHKFSSFFSFRNTWLNVPAALTTEIQKVIGLMKLTSYL